MSNMTQKKELTALQTMFVLLPRNSQNKKLPKTVANYEDQKQLLRASGSVGANYIEANEAVSKRDRQHRIKLCRKEAKESAYWLQLIDAGSSHTLSEKQNDLTKEAVELAKIFSTIMRKLE